MFPECRAVLVAPLVDSEGKWLGACADCDSPQRIVPQPGEKRRAVLMQGTKLRFVTALMRSWEALQGTSQRCAAFVLLVPGQCPALSCCSVLTQVLHGHTGAFWVNCAHTGRDAVHSVQPMLDKRAGVGTAGQRGTCTVSRAESVPELQMGTEKKHEVFDGFGSSRRVTWVRGVLVVAA